ncbi:MAG: pre-peptidase C-terminal domain-containing protein [Granulosicoccus sp.]
MEIQKIAALASIVVILSLSACSSSSSDETGEISPSNDQPSQIPVAIPVGLPTETPGQAPVGGLVDQSAEIPDEVTGNTANDVPVETPTGVPGVPTGVISEISVGAQAGEYFNGTPPIETGALTLDPLLDRSDPISIISGGSTEIGISSNQLFSIVYVLTGGDGYFVVQLAEATLAATLVVTYSTSQDSGVEGEIGVQVAGPGGDVSGAQSLRYTSVVVGTGDLQISVSWNSPTDVDLYLLEPGGEDINYDDVSSEAGGTLDLDSNSNCTIDGINNENITYQLPPPAGEYVVAVDYYSSCSYDFPTHYLVTVRANGTTTTYPGFFVPSDVQLEDVTEVTRFIVR